MKNIIFATSPDGVIGAGGTIPWRYPGDFRRFKRVTMGAALIMGRVTFESIGKPLPGRRNLVVTSRDLGVAGVECLPTIEAALASDGIGDVWFIGGARIYQAAMAHADLIDVTYVPDRVSALDAVYAPTIDERLFEPGPLLVHEDDDTLRRRVYHRVSGP